MSKSPRDVGWRPGDWDEDALRHGIEAARDVVRRIRKYDFPMQEVKWDNYPRICQSFVKKYSAIRTGGDD